jgi:hypothetical protein
MSVQYSVTHQNANVNEITTEASTTAYLLIYTGAAPASCGTASSGTLLASLPMSNPIAPGASAGVLTMSAITSAAAGNSGTAGYWRICTSSAGTTVVAQGTIYQTTTLVTSAPTAANGNILTFTSTTGVVSGMTVSGTGILAGTVVDAVSGTTVTISLTSTAGVSSSVTITFGGDMSMNSTTITAPQTVAVSSMTITANGA